jgi:hypothetical protein
VQKHIPYLKYKKILESAIAYGFYVNDAKDLRDELIEAYERYQEPLDKIINNIHNFQGMVYLFYLKADKDIKSIICSYLKTIKFIDF